MTTSARLAAGLTSMAGFTASGCAGALGAIGPITTLVLMAISLGIYVGALMEQRDRDDEHPARARPRPEPLKQPHPARHPHSVR